MSMKIWFLKVFFLVGCLLVAQVISLPAPDGIVGHGGHDGHSSYDEHPDPFHFEYGVHDDKYHTDFSEQRTGDETGSMKGEYTVALPDGRIQHVIYHADGVTVAQLWRSNIVERLTIQSTMDMLDMYKVVLRFLLINIFEVFSKVFSMISSIIQ